MWSSCIHRLRFGGMQHFVVTAYPYQRISWRLNLANKFIKTCLAFIRYFTLYLKTWNLQASYPSKVFLSVALGQGHWTLSPSKANLTKTRGASNPELSAAKIWVHSMLLLLRKSSWTIVKVWLQHKKINLTVIHEWCLWFKISYKLYILYNIDTNYTYLTYIYTVVFRVNRFSWCVAVRFYSIIGMYALIIMFVNKFLLSACSKYVRFLILNWRLPNSQNTLDVRLRWSLTRSFTNNNLTDRETSWDFG